MTEMQGVILRVPLRRLESQTAERYMNARRLEGFRAMRPDEEAASKRAYHLHLSRCSPGIDGVSRETFIKAMIAEGIPFSAGYPYPLYRQPFLARFRRPEEAGGGVSSWEKPSAGLSKAPRSPLV